MPKHLYSSAVIILLMLGLSSAIYGQGITVSPTRLFFSGEPGSVQKQSIVITNAGKEAVAFNVSLNDWYRDSIGQKVYLPANSTSRSNAGWIKTSANIINIPPGGSQELIATMQVPRQLKDDSISNSMLMLTQIARQEDRYLKQNNVGIKVLFEFALHVYFTPAANKTEDLDFVAIDTLSSKNGAGKRIAVKVKNTGNIISDAMVEFEFIHKTTGQESKLAPVAISMMPGASQIIYFDVPGQLKGAFKGVSILRIGDASNVKVGEKNLLF